MGAIGVNSRRTAPSDIRSGDVESARIYGIGKNTKGLRPWSCIDIIHESEPKISTSSVLCLRKRIIYAADTQYSQYE